MNTDWQTGNVLDSHHMEGQLRACSQPEGWNDDPRRRTSQIAGEFVESMKRALIQVVIFALVIFSGARQSFGGIPYTTNLLAVADASLDSNYPDTPLGSLPFVAAGVYNGETNRGLFRFDLSGIPTNAIVTNVTFSLVAYSQPPSGVQFGLTPVLTNWDENTVTWNNRSSLTPWTVPGGLFGTDFYVYPSAFDVPSGIAGSTNQFTDNGSDPYYGPVHDVQTWVKNPVQNFGWVLAAADEGSAGGVFTNCSRESSGSAPELTVVYTVPLTPPTLFGVTITNGLFQFSFRIEAYHGYFIQRCGDLTRTNWVTVEVFDPPGASSIADYNEPITNSSRFFRVVASN